ncbi:MAG TPA: hypothetical protein VFP24_05585 [Gaiellaceae bacterium]|jgi:hypothetical protein|nr:hypothetical protein [Gaiellaceae bacterium]
MAVENPRKPPDIKQEQRQRPDKPPGQFISNELEEETARFLREIKGLAKRREQAKSDESKGPPPKRPPDDQRSSRR